MKTETNYCDTTKSVVETFTTSRENIVLAIHTWFIAKPRSIYTRVERRKITPQGHIIKLGITEKEKAPAPSRRVECHTIHEQNLMATHEEFKNEFARNAKQLESLIRWAETY